MLYSETLLQSIAQTKATLKIITKTKNERFFIEKWIQHHLTIIGEGKLIIFDNMSDDEHVLRVYEKYKRHIILIKFDSHHDDIHFYGKFKDFYNTVGESTDFFTVLDSDEFLYLYGDDNTAIHDTSILDYLRKNKDCDFFAPCWLDNLKGEEKLLTLESKIHSPEEKVELLELFNWGKPIINSRLLKKLETEKYRNLNFCHTLYLPALNYKKAKTTFFIAHLKNLDTQQRILANMNKLVSFQILSNNNDFEGLFNLDLKTIGLTHLHTYIRQTKDLLRKSHQQPPKVSNNKILEMGKEDKIHFTSKLTEQAFSTLMNRSYLDLINYNYTEAKECLQLRQWIGIY